MRVGALAVVALVGVTIPSTPADSSVAELLEAGEAADGQVIVIVGELVGDFQRRGEWVWVQLNDDSYAGSPAPEGGPLTGANLGVAVRFAAGAFEAAGFDQPGRYGVRGPIVRVTAEWRYHDEARGGESYLAATAFEILERERRFEEDMPWGMLLAGLGLFALGGMIEAGRRRGAAAGHG